MIRIDEIIQLVRECALEHYRVIKNEPGFPGECALSSHLLGSYIRMKYGTDSVKLVYGTFGQHQLFHAWLERGDEIIDLTLFQFLAYKEKKAFYTKATGEDILQYALEHQKDIVISKTHPCRSLYRSIAEITPAFHCVGDKYASFLEQAMKSKDTMDLSWSHSPLEGRREVFIELLDSMKLRITRRLFTKWAIVPAI